MIEPDFLSKAFARETADEQAALYAEIYEEVMAERWAADLPESPIQAAAEAGRRLREELRRDKK